MTADSPQIDDKEAQLITQMLKGEKAAWELIVKTYYKPLYSFVNRMVKDNETAEELVQDVFVNFWAKREQINITISLKAYLYRAARNHTLNFIKRKNYELNYQKNAAYNYEPGRESTEESMRFNELEKALHQAIENLPEECREIFRLSRFEEMSYKEIAETLNIPFRSVHYQMGLALKSLRQHLKGYVSDDLMQIMSWLLMI